MSKPKVVDMVAMAERGEGVRNGAPALLAIAKAAMGSWIESGSHACFGDKCLICADYEKLADAMDELDWEDWDR